MGILEGKRGLVFGVANHRSYAWHISKSLLAEGARCAFAILPGEKMEPRARDAIAELGVDDAWIRTCDASKDADLDAVFEAYGADHDRLDFVVHSIAFAQREYLAPGAFHTTPRDAYLQAIDISSYTLVAMAQRARKQMAASGGGAILAMSYYGAEKAVTGYNVMGVAKAALECSTRYLASELGEDGIRVNCISGGPLKTLAAVGVSGFRKILSIAEEKAPLRRNVEGADVGGTAAWLISDLGRGVTGETVHVDCGLNTVAG